MTTAATSGQMLPALARDAIGAALGRSVAAPGEVTEWMREPGAVFVTLKLDGNLRGCVGTLECHRPLIDDLEANARAAAFDDPRFPPLTGEEFDRVQVEVSVLGPLEPIPFVDEADAVARLNPGRDGVLLRFGHQRGTFLPQVWEQLPEPAAFMAALKTKAGLPAGFWDPEIRLYRYRVDKFPQGEKGP